MLIKGYKIDKVVLRVNLIYFIVFLSSFQAFTLNPLKNEYLYMRVAESHNTTRKVLSACGVNDTSDSDVVVDKEVSRWTLLLSLSMFLPGCLSTMLLTSWGDKMGRKVVMVIPLLGMVLSTMGLAVIIYFKASLYWLYLYNVVAGSGGYYTGVLIQATAFLSDVTKPEERGIRLTILETSVGLAGGIAGIAEGYWVDSKGYVEPVVCVAAFGLFSLFLITLLPDSIKINKENKKRAEVKEDYERLVDEETNEELSSAAECGSIQSAVKIPERSSQDRWNWIRAVWKVYSSNYSHCDECHASINSKHDDTAHTTDRCVHGGGWYSGRVWRLWFYLLSYDLYMMVVVGTIEFQTIYFLSEPLCFTNTLVGAQLGLRFALYTFVPFIVWFCQKCLGFSNDAIVIIGLIAYTTNGIVMAFADQTYIVFIATGTYLFTGSLKPFIQAQISRLVADFEIGAAFALISSTEVMSYIVGTTSFLTLYQATVGFLRGFAWLFAAGITTIPILLISVIQFKNLKAKKSPQGGASQIYN